MPLQQSTDKNWKMWNEPNPRLLFQACFLVQMDNYWFDGHWRGSQSRSAWFYFSDNTPRVAEHLGSTIDAARAVDPGHYVDNKIYINCF